MFRPMIIAAALLATSAQAGKPAPPPPPAGTASPEVIYTFAGTKGGYELRVANKDGTGAVTLHKGTALVIGKFGPRADKTIAFYSGPEMYLLTYVASASGVVESSRRLLFNNGGGNAQFDFSGADVAWWNSHTGDIHIYNVSAGTDHVVVNVPDLAGISFNPAGTEIFYGKGNGAGQYALHRIAVAGGTPAPVGVTHNATTFDSGHAADSFVIAAPQSGTWYLNYVPAGATSGQ